MEKYAEIMNEKIRIYRLSHPQTDSDKYPNFSLVAGTQLLEPQILSLKPIVHIFGI